MGKRKGGSRKRRGGNWLTDAATTASHNIHGAASGFTANLHGAAGALSSYGSKAGDVFTNAKTNLTGHFNNLIPGVAALGGSAAATATAAGHHLRQSAGHFGHAAATAGHHLRHRAVPNHSDQFVQQKKITDASKARESILKPLAEAHKKNQKEQHLTARINAKSTQLHQAKIIHKATVDELARQPSNTDHGHHQAAAEAAKHEVLDLKADVAKHTAALKASISGGRRRTRRKHRRKHRRTRRKHRRTRR